MKPINKIILFAIIMVTASGCSWENEEILYPETEVCDTLDVSFAEDIVPILTNNCYQCHSNVNGPEIAFGITLEDYEDVSAESSIIVGAINHREGFPAMPKGGEQLDTCLIDIIEAWVNQGGLNN